MSTQNVSKTVEATAKHEAIRNSAAAYVAHFASASDALHALTDSMTESERDRALFRRVRGHKWILQNRQYKLERAEDSTHSAYYFAGFHFNVWKSASGWNSNAIPEVLFDSNGRQKNNSDSRARGSADSEDKAIRYVMMRACAIIANKLDAREIAFSDKDVSQLSVAHYDAMSEALAKYVAKYGELD